MERPHQKADPTHGFPSWENGEKNVRSLTQVDVEAVEALDHP